LTDCEQQNTRRAKAKEATQAKKESKVAEQQVREAVRLAKQEAKQLTEQQAKLDKDAKKARNKERRKVSKRDNLFINRHLATISDIMETPKKSAAAAVGMTPQEKALVRLADGNDQGRREDAQLMHDVFQSHGKERAIERFCLRTNVCGRILATNDSVYERMFVDVFFSIFF
jgi:hypothetical protein